MTVIHGLKTQPMPQSHENICLNLKKSAKNTVILIQIHRLHEKPTNFRPSANKIKRIFSPENYKSIASLALSIDPERAMMH